MENNTDTVKNEGVGTTSEEDLTPGEFITLVVVFIAVSVVLVRWLSSRKNRREAEEHHVANDLAKNATIIRIQSINFYNGTPEQSGARANAMTPQDEEEQETTTESVMSVAGDSAPTSATTQSEGSDPSKTILEPNTCADTGENNNFATFTLHTPDKTSIVKQFPSSTKLAEILAWIAKDCDRNDMVKEIRVKSSEGQLMWTLGDYFYLEMHARKLLEGKADGKLVDMTAEELKLDGCEVLLEAGKLSDVKAFMKSEKEGEVASKLYRH